MTDPHHKPPQQPYPNPYAPPVADHAGVPAVAPTDGVRLYSPQHVVLASFIGTPLAGGWLLAQNFGKLGDKSAQWKALLGSAAASVLLMVISSWLPGSFPRLLLPAAYCWGMYALARGLQGEAFRRHVHVGGAVHSGWRAAGVGCVGMLAVLVAVFAVAALFMKELAV